MASWRALAVAATVLLAGCASIAAGPGATPTITPAPVPEGTPTPFTPTPSTLAPGVTTGGVGDIDRLIAAHRRGLANRSYTVVATISVIGVSGENWSGYEPRQEGERVLLLGDRRVVRVAAGGYPRTVVRGFDGRLADGLPVEPGTDRGSVPVPVTVETWTDGEASYRRVAGEGTIAYAVDEENTSGWGETEDSTVIGIVKAPLQAVPTSAGRMSPVGRRIIIAGYAAAVDRPELLTTDVPVVDPRNVGLTARVSDDGLVLEFDLRYDATLLGRPVEVRLSVEVRDLDTTSVGRPAWVATARNATG